MTKSELKIPRNLKHKPVIFEKIFDDGDAKYFSIGKAQWDNNDFSIKVFRYVNNRWSPQSEEIPLGRFLKMAEFLIECIDGNFERKKIQDKCSFEEYLKGELHNFRNRNAFVFENIYKILQKWQREE